MFSITGMKRTGILPQALGTATLLKRKYKQKLQVLCISQDLAHAAQLIHFTGESRKPWITLCFNTAHNVPRIHKI